MSPIDEYILKQNAAVQPQLNAIRETIRAAIPDAVEKISYQMPTYWKGRNIIHFAAFRNHIGLFPGGEAPDVFADRLKSYKTSKRNPTMYEQTLSHLIEETKAGRMFGEWNDYGRLLDY